MSTGERDQGSHSQLQQRAVHDGAFIHSLEQELRGMHVHREAYYGGTFTGNSAHRCLKVIEEIYI